MKELTEELIELINGNEWLIFYTAKDNNPRAIKLLPSRVEKNRIILSNIQMDKSIDNIINNPNCFINVYIKERDMQIKMDCLADVLDEGSLYQEIKEYEETNNLPEDLKVRSIIVANIKNIEVCEG